MAGLTTGGLIFAVFCAIWTLFTAFLATLVAFVYIRSRKTIDFISLISLVVFVAMFASFLQQVYTYSNWDSVKEQERLDSIMTAEEGMFFDVGSNKFIKGVYYVQILCYNIGGTLIAFWAFFLWASIQPLKGNWWRSRRFTASMKGAAVASACTLFGISQAEIFAHKPMKRFVVANVQLITVLALTPFFLIMIVHRFISVRLRATGAIKEIRTFPLEHSHNSSQTSGTANTLSLANARKSKDKEKTLSTMLLLRFACGVLVMSGLEAFHICFQLLRISNFSSSTREDAEGHIKTIPTTTGAQIVDIVFFLPSTSQGWLLFLVFGTTKEQWGDIKTLLARVFCFCLPGVWRSNSNNDIPTRDSSVEIIPSPKAPAEWIDLKGKAQCDGDMPYDGTNPPARRASRTSMSRNSSTAEFVVIRNEINSLCYSPSGRGLRRSDLVKPLPILPGMQVGSYPQRDGRWVQGSVREVEMLSPRSPGRDTEGYTSPYGSPRGREQRFESPVREARRFESPERGVGREDFVRHFGSPGREVRRPGEVYRGQGRFEVVEEEGGGYGRGRRGSWERDMV
ncbi:hypothetical protein BJ508DRAFT_314514 [Ascobolus immersus RN42]|uniref:Uncharacterized protein n=1 Tax=Ascobolus immersus RN42 TaxID=1160509 RepID=A0A3N4HEP6_ASCIM|nr:hypothetical protein BJ508DRAFT_314514 [Ascobolus immersus RN42]